MAKNCICGQLQCYNCMVKHLKGIMSLEMKLTAEENLKIWEEVKKGHQAHLKDITRHFVLETLKDKQLAIQHDLQALSRQARDLIQELEALDDQKN